MKENFASQTIVIADDNPINREDYEMMLQVLGCRIVTLSSTQEVFDFCDTQPAPDLILLDLYFPEMEDGLATCGRVRSRFAELETSIVMITAVGHDPENLQRCLEAGADDFIVRGMTLEDVLLRVRSKLHVQQANRAHVARERDAERLKILSEFADSVKHDVGNALNVIDVVFDDFNLSQERLQELKASIEQQIHSLEETFKTNHDQLEMLQKLVVLQVRAMQELAKSGGTEKEETFDIAELMQDAHALAGGQVKPSVVHLHCPPHLDAKVTMYRFGLLFSLREMVLNASTFIRQHGEVHQTQKWGNIEMTAERVLMDGKPMVRIRIADDGPGVDEKIRDQIFNRGFRSRPGVSEPGGWGLYAAKMRVEKAKGTLRHEHNQPRGAVFIIELPLS